MLGRKATPAHFSTCDVGFNLKTRLFVPRKFVFKLKTCLATLLDQDLGVLHANWCDTHVLKTTSSPLSAGSASLNHSLPSPKAANTKKYGVYFNTQGNVFHFMRSDHLCQRMQGRHALIHSFAHQKESLSNLLVRALNFENFKNASKILQALQREVGY